MDEAVPLADDEGAAPARPRRLWRPFRWLLIGLAGLALIVAGAIWGLDTSPGRRFLADRIAALSPSSGLRIRIGRIDGSIWGDAVLRDLRLYDSRGLFLEAPEVVLSWRPAMWLANRLEVRRLQSDLIVVRRLPRLKPSGNKGPILPGFDVRIDRLDARLVFAPAVAGSRRVARLTGRTDIRDGRALIDLKAASSGGDRLSLLLDAEPDRDRFDLSARVAAPSGGVIGALFGTRRPIALSVAGRGDWNHWAGKALADIAGHRTIDLGLGVREGRYSLSGTLAPAPLLKGKLQRLSSPAILVTGEATLADRRLDSSLSLRSGALAIDASGVLDLADSAFDGLRVNAHLLKPPALFPNMTGSNVRLTATFEGPFATAAFDYVVTASRVAFDQTGFEDVRAEGRGRLSKSPVAVPVRLRARRVTGVGTVAGGILANLRVDGVLRITGKAITGEGMTVDSDKVRGKLALLIDLATGEYTVTLSGQLSRYLIPGLGLVDVMTDLKVVPGAGGRGTRVEGRGRAWVRRFDNAFLRGLAGGLPHIETRLVRGPDGILMFQGLVLTGPTIRIAGNGLRRRDGSFQFGGTGTQGRYGPFKISLDGDISRPKLDLLLARPADALGLAAVSLHLDPEPAGYGWRAAGGSTLGPFGGNGHVLLPANAAATVVVDTLDVSRTRASGALRSDPAGFTGQLKIAGGGLDGQLTFAPVGTVQRIEAHIAAVDAYLAGVPDLSVRRGRVDGAILLDPAGTAMEGKIAGRGLRRGGLSLGRLDASGSLRGGAGTVTASLAGSRGRNFALQTVAKLAPGRVELAGSGVIDRRPLTLAGPAVLTRDGNGWALAPTALGFASGGINLSGRFGDGPNRIDATVDRMPLAVLDIFYPELGLGGNASGRIFYTIPANAVPPQGRATLTIRGLTRSGLVLSSRPVDAAVSAVLNGGAAAARAVIVDNGRTIGRAQARLAPIAPGGGDLQARLAAAPLFAQLRYDGPADTLWRLTGIETIDLSGPLAVAADIGGRLSDPAIRGSVRLSGARLESAVSGTVVQGVNAAGRFNGSRLVIDRLTGGTAGGGGVSARGSFDLSAARGIGMDIAVDAKNALILNRDDIRAIVSGPISFNSDGAGGVIGGDVRLDSGRFRLGQAVAQSALPRLPITTINQTAEDTPNTAASAPWRLDLHARASSRLMVNGLGLDSEWRADLAIKGTVENPAITGRADLIRGGYEFAGRRFDLDRGVIRFLGEAPPDPVLDIVAKASIQGLNATIQVSGTGQKPEVSFASIPALPEDELLSRLLFGTSITNLSAPEALQLAAAVASLRGGGGGGLNPINAVRRAAGLDRLRILPADVTTGQGTSIAAGKYIGRRTYVEVITDGAGYSATRVEFQLTRWLSLLSTISTIGRQSANVRISKDY